MIDTLGGARGWEPLLALGSAFARHGARALDTALARVGQAKALGRPDGPER